MGIVETALITGAVLVLIIIIVWIMVRNSETLLSILGEIKELKIITTERRETSI